jgi:two-component system chemotaxis response regulator CheY
VDSQEGLERMEAPYGRPQEAAGQDGRTGMRALIVDDSRFIRQYLRQLLEGIGLSCEEAVDGRDALHLLRGSAPFDFMLLDVNMPQMGGLDCVKAVRDAGLHPPMKVMMVTTETDNTFICRALQYGADEFLMKPFTPESLREKLTMLGLAA